MEILKSTPSPKKVAVLEKQEKQERPEKSEILEDKEKGEPPKNRQDFRRKRKWRKLQEGLVILVLLLILCIGGSLFFPKYLSSFSTNSQNKQNESLNNASTSVLEEEGLRRIEYIQEFMKENVLPKDQAQIVSMLKKTIEDYPGEVAEKAKMLLSLKEEEFEKEAQKEFLRVKMISMKFLTQGAYLKAEESYLDFSEEYKLALWYTQSKTNKNLMAKLGRQFCQKLKQEALDRIEEGRFEEAIEIYKKMILSGYPDVVDQAKHDMQKAQLSLKKISNGNEEK